MGRSGSLRAVLPAALAVAVLLASPAGRAAERAEYEATLLQWGLARTGRVPEPAPEGKRIDEILIAAEEIVAESDPYPQLMNWVHVRTRDPVIRREVLLQEGELYDPARVAETERNLRRLAFIAVARVVAVQGRAPGTVALLVVTKDLWSIRLNSELAMVGSLVQRLRVRPSETNFLGLGQQLSADLWLKLDVLQVGQSYTDRRLLGSRLTLSESGALIFNRETGHLEGSRGAVGFGLPLTSLEQEWGYTIAANWLHQTSRIYRGAAIWQLPFPGGALVPYVYGAEELAASALGTRSFGRAYKLELSAGAGAYRRRYEAPAELTEAERTFLLEGYLPRSETAAYLTAIARFYEPRYARLRDVETFGLTEDYLLGPWAQAQVRWAPGLLGATFSEAGLAVRYRWLLGEDLLTLGTAAAARHELDVAPTPWVNRRFAAELENAFAPLGPGRFVVRGAIDLRAFDLDHTRLLLGGGNGLRGAPPESQSGSNALLFNLEYRTRPWVVQTLHVGAAAFYDAGSAFDERPSLVHTVGLGLRFLFPQFDVQPVRLDFGYALNGPQPGFVGRISLGFGQITDYRPALLDDPL